MDAYRADVLRHLSFTECQQRLTGDVGALRRLWRFLHHWGVINFQAGEVASASEPRFLVTPGGANAPLTMRLYGFRTHVCNISNFLVTSGGANAPLGLGALGL